jgi:hypothetical protein
MNLRAKTVHEVNKTKQVVSEEKISPSLLLNSRSSLDIVKVTKQPTTSSKFEISQDPSLTESQYFCCNMLKVPKPAYYDDDEGSIESIEEEFSEGSMLDLAYFMIPEDIFA